jgi:small subunit ribosomal protein S21
LSKIEKIPTIYNVKPKKIMIIIEVKNEKSIEQALKSYKFKIYKTKQVQNLQERKEYKKPSVKRRAQIKKAQYKQKNQLDS